jgi:hypothetical protein
VDNVSTLDADINSTDESIYAKPHIVKDSDDNANANDSHSQINRSQAERHLQLLDPEADSFVFQTFSDSKQHPKPDPLTKILTGTLDQHWQSLCRLSGQGAGVFVTVNESNGGRKKSDVTRIRAVWQEDDRGNSAPLPVEPHIVIESSPGKYHRYILTDQVDVERFEPVQERLVLDHGSDPNAKDRSRVLRLAGFPHQKDPKRPHLVRILHESGEPPYSWADVEKAFPPVEHTGKGKGKGKGNWRQSVVTGNGRITKIADVSAALNHLDPDCDYQDWLKIGAALHHACGGGAEGLKVWDDWSRGLYAGESFSGSKFVEGECQYRYSTFALMQKDSPATLKTIFRMARDAGWNGKPATDVDNVSPDERRLIRQQHDRELDEFSRLHGFVDYQGAARIAYRVPDMTYARKGVKGVSTWFAKVPDVEKKYANRHLWHVDGGRLEQRNLVKTWMQSYLRRDYKGVILEPVGGMISGGLELPDKPYLNLYTGLTCKPKKGGFELISKHIREVWCSGDEDAYRYVINWLARMYQQPHELGRTALVLQSGEGTGKGAIVDMLLESFGEHGVSLTRIEDATGTFSTLAKRAVLLYLNEAVFGGDKRTAGPLKSLVTDPMQKYEEKHLPALMLRSCLHIIVSSNNDWAVPIGIDDRRFVVLQVSEKHKNDPAYFEPLWSEIRNGGKEAFIHHLLHDVDISGFNPSVMPAIAGSNDLKLQAKLRGDHVLAFAHGMLSEQSVKTRTMSMLLSKPWSDEPLLVDKDDLYDAYTEFCSKLKDSRPESKTMLTKKLGKYLGAKTVRPRTKDSERPRCYQLPGWSEAREVFESATGQKLTLDDCEVIQVEDEDDDD